MTILNLIPMKGKNGRPFVDLKLEEDNESNKHMDCSADFYEHDRLKYTIQEIGDMPHRINMQKSSNTLKNEPTANPVDIKKFNDAQMVALSNCTRPLYMYF